MKNIYFTLATLLLVGFSSISFAEEAIKTDESKQAKDPLKVLVITGGCCHDYDFQSKKLVEAAERNSLDVDWTIVNEGGKGTKAQINFYRDPNWAEGFDVVIHNECFANTQNPEYIRKITQAHHDGANAVVIHCAMHTYRASKIDDWREFLGVTSRHHEHKSEYPVKTVKSDHPVMEGFPMDYVTPNDELYIIKHVWPNTEILATSTSEKTGEAQPVFWTNKYGKARVFGTTYGHSNPTFADETFQDVLMRGMLWAAGRLGGSDEEVVKSDSSNEQSAVATK